MSSTLEEVLEYGPIVAMEPELGLLVTINGSYLNLWRPFGKDHWENVDCRSRDGRDLYKTTVAQAMDDAKEWLAALLTDESEVGNG